MICEHKEMMEMISKIPVIDAHDHLVSEKQRVEMKVDLFALLLTYTQCDLGAAGMPPLDRRTIYDGSLPIETRWKSFAPYWPHIRHTSYSKAFLITLRDLYGFEDLNEFTYLRVSEAIHQANTPGIYGRILRDKCGIKKVLTQTFFAAQDDEIFRSVIPFGLLPVWDLGDASDLERVETERKRTIRTADDLEALCAEVLHHWVADLGVVGFKMAGVNYPLPRTDEVNTCLEDIREKGTVSEVQRHLLNSAIVHFGIQHSIELSAPVAIHLGATADNWMNFCAYRPENVIPLLERHRDARFDLYHLGIPWQDTVALMGKIYPNVWINLCWCHIISQAISEDAIARILDLVPTNKVIGFGADYLFAVENVYGHLVMARENIAAALCKKGIYSDAEKIALAWLYETPKQLYGL